MKDRSYVLIVAIIAAACVAMVALVCFTQLPTPTCPSGKVYMDSRSGIASGCVTTDEAKNLRP